ncbi:transposase [Williamsia limnetica]|uniref:Transposase n=1 Tax=Williamsia limnetica TaxID=882452 RepID=A0A318RA83_WILLI|nr:transposase [Williamsia limnetica]
MPKKYDEATRAKAVRLVVEHRDEYPSEYAAITATAKRLKLTPETLRKWVRQQEVDQGGKPGVTREEAAEVRVLKRKVLELEETVEILKAATTFFARESDPRQQ